MNTTRSLTSTPSGRPTVGVSGKIRAFFRGQYVAQELLLEKQAPWLGRR